MKSYAPERDRPHEGVGDARAPTSPAARSYVATFGLGISSRSSPGHAVSMPPLKKYVTWAYFSVSATWNWRQPGLAERLGQRARGLGRERDEDRQALLVLGHRHDEEILRAPDGPRATSVEPVERRAVGERVGQLPRAVGAEVQVDDRVTVQRAASAPSTVDDRRHDELVGLAARVGGLDRGGRRRRAVCRLAVDDRVVAALGPLPALVAVHRVVAAADGRDRRAGWAAASRASRSCMNASADDGGVSRPSSRAWTASRGTPSRCARLGERDQVAVVGVDAARPDEA